MTVLKASSIVPVVSISPYPALSGPQQYLDSWEYQDYSGRGDGGGGGAGGGGGGTAVVVVA